MPMVGLLLLLKLNLPQALDAVDGDAEDNRPARVADTRQDQVSVSAYSVH